MSKDRERSIESLDVSQRASPFEFESQYEQIKNQLSDDLLPKWMMGLGDLPASAHDQTIQVEGVDDGQRMMPTERMVSKLIEWLNHREDMSPINPENILELSSKLLKHGYGQERTYVYGWMRAKRYRMISYAIVKRIIEYGRRELDLPLLRDELNRYRAQTRRSIREVGMMESRNINTSARFEVELLDALSHFGDQEAKVELLSLSVSECKTEYERAVKRAAIDKLADDQRRYFGIDLDSE